MNPEELDEEFEQTEYDNKGNIKIPPAFMSMGVLYIPIWDVQIDYWAFSALLIHEIGHILVSPRFAPLTNPMIVFIYQQVYASNLSANDINELSNLTEDFLLNMRMFTNPRVLEEWSDGRSREDTYDSLIGALFGIYEKGGEDHNTCRKYGYGSVNKLSAMNLRAADRFYHQRYGRYPWPGGDVQVTAIAALDARLDPFLDFDPELYLTAIEDAYDSEVRLMNAFRMYL